MRWTWRVATVLALLAAGYIPADSGPARSSASGSAPLPRATTDRPDDSPGYQVHFVYALPNDGRDLQRDLNGEITNSAAAFQHWLKGQADGSSLRTDTYQGGLDISFARLPRLDAQYIATGPYVRDEIEKDLRTLGFADPRKLYAVFWEGGSVYACGGGAYPPRLMGQVAAIYLNGTPPLGGPCNLNELGASPTVPGYLDFGMLHEIFHTLGFVAECAPNHHSAGHSSDDPTDLMYAGTEVWRPAVLDVGRDDYYEHDEDGCIDFADSAFRDPLPARPEPPPEW